MADGKREYEYDVAISLATYVNASFSGKFNPNTANPVRNERTEALVRKYGDKKGAEAFAIIGAGLKMVAESWPKGGTNGNGQSFNVGS